MKNYYNSANEFHQDVGDYLNSLNLKSATLISYNVYTAISNWNRNINGVIKRIPNIPLPSYNYLDHMQKIMSAINKVAGNVIIGPFKAQNIKDLIATMQAWPNINWFYCDTLHTKMLLINSEEAGSEIWFGSGNFAGSTGIDFVVKHCGHEQGVSAIKHLGFIKKQCVPFTTQMFGITPVPKVIRTPVTIKKTKVVVKRRTKTSKRKRKISKR